MKELVQVLGQMSEGATVGIVGYEGTGKILGFNTIQSLPF